MERVPTADLNPHLARLEEARIRAAYATRRDDNAKYSGFNRDQFFRIKERERRVLTRLDQCGFNPLDEKNIGNWLWTRLLASGIYRIELKRITLAPPLARWIAPRSCFWRIYWRESPSFALTTSV